MQGHLSSSYSDPNFFDVILTGKDLLGYQNSKISLETLQLITDGSMISLCMKWKFCTELIAGAIQMVYHILVLPLHSLITQFMQGHWTLEEAYNSLLGLLQNSSTV